MNLVLLKFLQSYSIDVPIGLSNLLLKFLIVKNLKIRFSRIKTTRLLFVLLLQRYVFSFDCASFFKYLFLIS